MLFERPERAWLAFSFASIALLAAVACGGGGSPTAPLLPSPVAVAPTPAPSPKVAILSVDGLRPDALAQGRRAEPERAGAAGRLHLGRPHRDSVRDAPGPRLDAVGRGPEGPQDHLGLERLQARAGVHRRPHRLLGREGRRAAHGHGGRQERSSSTSRRRGRWTASSSRSAGTRTSRTRRSSRPASGSTSSSCTSPTSTTRATPRAGCPRPTWRRSRRWTRPSAELLAALPPQTTVILTADHGGKDRDHGPDVPENMTVPWIVAGPKVAPSRRDDGRVSGRPTPPPPPSGCSA